MRSVQVSKTTGPLEIIEKNIPELGARRGYDTRKSSLSNESGTSTALEQAYGHTQSGRK